MSTFKRIFLYFIYIITAAGFFLYILFPSDMVKKYIAAKVNQANPNINMKIDRVTPVLPPGLKFYEVELFQEDNSLIKIDQIKAVPNLISLFQPEIKFTFKGTTCKGNLNGKGLFVKPDKKDNPSNAASRLTIDTDLAGIHIKDINAVKNYSDYQLSGILDGNIIYTGKEPLEKLAAKLNITDSNIDLAPISQRMGLLAPMLKVGSLKFKTINTDLTMDKNRNLRIKECIMKGTQMNGDISGSVFIRTPSEKSELNLTGNMKPHPSFIASLGKTVSLLFKNMSRAGENGLPFKISGTAENPRFSLK